MTIDDYNSIQRPAVRALIPKMGYNRNTRNTPCAVVYGPVDLGGVGAPDLYSVQGAKKVMMLLEHLRAESTLGSTLRNLIQWTQHLTGVGFDILREPHRRLPPSAGDTWVRGVRDFLKDSNCQLLIQQTRLPEPRRGGDITIMDAALEAQIPSRKLKSIQKVRLFLRITYVSDAFDACGAKPLTEIVKREAIKTSLPTELFPRQAPPMPDDWKAFLWFLRSNKPKLGPWSPSWQRHRVWNNVYCTTTKSFWTLVEGEWERNPAPITCKRQYAILDPFRTSPGGEPVSPIPIDVLPANSGRVRVNIPKHDPPIKPTEPPDTYAEEIRELPEWERQLLRYTKEHSDALSEAIEHGSTIRISYHGATNDAKGTFGWAIHVADQLQWTGDGIALGQPMTKLRAHAYGRLAALAFLRLYRRINEVEAFDPKLEFITDHQPLNRRLQQHENRPFVRPRYCSDSDYDVILEIGQLQQPIKYPTISASPMCPSTEHPASNQSNRELAIAANLASSRLQRMKSYHRPSPLLPLPTCPTYVLHRNQPITCFETSTLQTSYNRERLWQYMIERHKWSKRTAATVNLNALRAARNKSPSLQRFTTRLLQGHLPTLHRLHQQGRTTSNLCPRCQNEETHDHMFQCPHREEWREGFLERLDSHLKNHETDVSKEVLECTRAWLKATQPNLQAHCNQLDVGIHLLHRGLLGVDWSYRQQAHYQSNDLPQTGHLWAQHLILFLWEEAFELWTQRNNDIHEPDETILRQDLIQQVEEIYELEPLTLAQDRDNFCIPLNTRLTHNTNQLHNYVQSQGYIVRASVREAANLAARTFQPIRDFFTRR